MLTRYRIPATEHSFAQDIKHSRFIATVVHAPTVTDAKTAIVTIAARYPDATHNCWAFVAGIGAHAEIGSSDDGEPSGRLVALCSKCCRAVALAKSPPW
ncbi:MAG: YigZ family protein [Herpetosiphon sp.]|nr:YigZ family protein [Herpetosiphon sp.]